MKAGDDERIHKVLKDEYTSCGTINHQTGAKNFSSFPGSRPEAGQSVQMSERREKSACSTGSSFRRFRQAMDRVSESRSFFQTE